MQSVMSIALKRDCEATQVPSGVQTMLTAGTEVDITQHLGGSYTVHPITGGLFRIAEKDADALGLQSEAATTPSAEPPGPLDEKAVWKVLKDCYDPEIPLNIVDLGLVYEMRIIPLPEGGHAVAVKMTLTAPGCGMGGAIAGDAQQKLMGLPGVKDAQVEIVWDPPWHPSLITPEGKRVLGLE
jgi:probable FeS assembly SUF system protein SufT